MSRAEIEARIPHRPPFLWLDEIVAEDETTLSARKTLDPELPVFQGHYPDFPLLPGVLVCEAIYQAGALLLARTAQDQLGEGKIPVLTRARDTRFKAMVRPGDVLEVSVELEDSLSGLFHLRGTASVGDKVAVSTRFSVALAPTPSE